MAGWHDIEELTYPYRVRWYLSTPDGPSYTQLCLDIQNSDGDGEKALQLMKIWWVHVFAPLSCMSVTLERIQVDALKLGPTSGFLVDGQTHGHLLSDAAELRDSMVIVLHSFDLDSWGKRRLYIPGIPRAWVDRGVLKVSGRNAGHTAGRTIQNAAGWHGLGGPYKVVIYRPPGAYPAQGGLLQHGYRKVAGYRILTFTDDPGPVPI